jgi:hypothetical protein
MPEDFPGIAALLNRNVTAVSELEEFWNLQVPSWQLKHRPPADTKWRSEIDVNWCPEDLFRYGEACFRTGTVFVSFYSKIVVFWSSGRFRGWLLSARNRTVHRRVGHQLARIFNSTAIAWLSESAVDHDRLLSMQSMDEVISSLVSTIGPAQPSIDSVSEQVLAAAKNGVPEVWYLERPPFVFGSPS